MQNRVGSGGSTRPTHQVVLPALYRCGQAVAAVPTNGGEPSRPSGTHMGRVLPGRFMWCNSGWHKNIGRRTEREGNHSPSRDSKALGYVVPLTSTPAMPIYIRSAPTALAPVLVAVTLVVPLVTIAQFAPG